MSQLTITEILQQAPDVLEQLTGANVEVVASAPASDVDLAVEIGPPNRKSTLIIEAKNSGTTNQIAAAVTQLRTYLRHTPSNHFGVIAVPFMGETGQRICEENDISWFDLSGNAEISARGLRIRYRGKPNKFKRRGRPKSLFAASGSRIARTFLINPERRYLRRELSRVARVSEGHTGNLVRRYLREGLLEDDDHRGLYCPNPGLLLDTWREEYDFSRHRIVRGHMAVRGSGTELMHIAYDRLQELDLHPALTGLAAAWSYDHFAAFRLVSTFVNKMPNEQDFKAMEFREGSRGSNVWLVIPDNDGVYDGAQELDGRQHVHPVQVYLDLKDQPERAAEAAESLRKNRPEIDWKMNDNEA